MVGYFIVIGILALLVVMFLALWLLAKSDISKLKLRSQLLSEQAEQDKVRQKQDKENLKDTFKVLASNVFEGNSKQFLELARSAFNEINEKATGDLGKKHIEIDALLKPVSDNLSKLSAFNENMEKERQRSYQSVQEQLHRVVESSVTLSKETRALKDALKKPHVRGRWGEVQLKNCVELAGMSEYADISFQQVNDDGDGKKLIPDLVVKMPGGRKVFVDAKTPIDAFLASLECDSEEGKNAQMVRHGKQVVEHVRDLAKKDYGTVLNESADFTVMFLPNESFLYAALESQPNLIEYAIERKVLVATPPTLVGLLKVIRYGWNEERLARNAQEISETASELHKRLVDFVEAFLGVGKGLDDAKKKFDIGLSRLNSRVLVQARKMEKLGAKSRKELPEDLGSIEEEIEILPEVQDAEASVDH